MLFRHQATICMNKYDLDLAKDFSQKIHLKDNEPIYQKKIQITWISQSIHRTSTGRIAKTRGGSQNALSVQFSNLLHSHETRVRTQNCERLRTTQSPLSHRQIFHQGNKRMHWGHWSSQLIHFFNAGPHLGILADETGGGITAINSVHHFGPQAISLDHCTHGLTRMPSQFSKVNGTSSTRTSKCSNLHWQRTKHTDTHKRHLEALEQVLLKLRQNHLKINLDKCLFGDKRVSYLGFTLTPRGIKPGEAKFWAKKNSTAPKDVKSIESFVGLCKFFHNHIQNFAITPAPLFKLTRQDSRYTSGSLPRAAQEAFKTLQK